jgi:hypothetical protein
MTLPPRQEKQVSLTVVLLEREAQPMTDQARAEETLFRSYTLSNCSLNPTYRSSSGQDCHVIGRVDHFIVSKTLPIMELCRGYLLCGYEASSLTSGLTGQLAPNLGT